MRSQHRDPIEKPCQQIPSLRRRLRRIEAQLARDVRRLDVALKRAEWHPAGRARDGAQRATRSPGGGP